MDPSQNEIFGSEGFRHRRQPLLVATGAHSDGILPERAPERPIEMSRLLPTRASADVEVNELVEINDQSRPSLNRLHQSSDPWTGSDAESLVSSHAASSNGGFSRLANQHHHLDIKRPDSVITTSSIVSSSDTASQAGDSSSIEVGLPPSVYAISGLYGPVSGSAASHHRHHSDANPRTNHVSGVAEPQPTFISHINGARRTSDDLHGMPNAISCVPQIHTSAAGTSNAFLLPQHPVGKQILTHRRQTSHPVILQNSGTGSAVPPAVAAASRTLPQQHVSVSRHASNPVCQPPVQAAAIVSTHVKGHKRSHSYGYHRNPPMFQQSHRRTGSSVIDTLHTLACNGASEQELNPHESIVQYLEKLRKEQREKYERQELHEMQDQLEDLRDCGLLGCRPHFIQGLANIKVFVFLMALLVTLQQALSSGYLNSVITTIEKRYEIPSSISGIIASMYEIGNVITVIFASYLGSRRHIPVFIGMGVLVMGIASITFSLPHFLTGNHGISGTLSDSHNMSMGNICVRNNRLMTAAKTKASAGEELLMSLPGLEKIKSLTEGLESPPLAPHNNPYNRADNCIEQAAESAAVPIFIFMVAQFLLGCGGSPLFTLGTTYIDNHVKRDSSSVYIGFVYSMCAFGPVCGFLLGAFLLSHHVDTFSYDVSQLSIDSTDRHWVGMWWGGFLICGACLLLISIPFFFYPKELKKEKVKVYIDEKYHHASDPSIRPNVKRPKITNALSPAGSTATTTTATTAYETGLPAPLSAPPSEKPSRASTLVRQSSNSSEEKNNYGKSLKDIPRSTWKLLTNKIYIVTCLGACMELIIVSGFIVFLPKYLETQFNLSKSMASMFTGGIAIPGACIGILLGGYILKRLQLKPKGAAQLVVFFNVLCLACYVMLFFFGCDNIKMAGTTSPYSHKSNQSDYPFKINLTASCNFGCECDMNDVQPVCGSNGLTYFSPCHAGCSQGSSNGNFSNCACVLNTKMESSLDEEVNSRPLLSGGGKHSEHHQTLSTNSGNAHPEEYVSWVPVATSGACSTECQMIFPFMVLLFFMTLLVAVTQMPVLMLVLRAVDEEEKAFALGIQCVIFRLFGYIPSPILFGNVIDSTCILWKSTCEGEAGGRCLLYDIEAFRYKYVGVCAFIKVCSMLIFILDWWLIRNRQRSEKKEKAAMTVGEAVNSIISLDKLFDPEGPMYAPMADAENPSQRIEGSAETLEELDTPTGIGRNE